MSLKVELLENSFEEVRPHANEFVASFSENLFTASPEAKPLFEHTNMASQEKMLLSSLVLVVDNLRSPDVLDNSLRGLGARHVKYGALPEHYPLVGGALLTTFEQYLKEKWTPDVKQAWVDAYGAISQMMLDGADYSQAEIALDLETDNSETSTSSANSLSNGDVSGNIPSVNIESGNPSSGSGNVAMAALARGGIMGILAILILLF